MSGVGFQRDAKGVGAIVLASVSFVGNVHSLRVDSTAAMSSSTCCCSQMSGGRRRKVVGPAGRTRTPRSCKRAQGRGHPLLELDPDHHAAAADLAYFGAADAGETIHELSPRAADRA